MFTTHGIPKVINLTMSLSGQRSLPHGVNNWESSIAKSLPCGMVQQNPGEDHLYCFGRREELAFSTVCVLNELLKYSPFLHWVVAHILNDELLYQNQDPLFGSLSLI